MGYYNRKHNSTNPMLDDWVQACYTLAKSSHLISKEDEKTLMEIARKVSSQSKYSY